MAIMVSRKCFSVKFLRTLPLLFHLPTFLHFCDYVNPDGNAIIFLSKILNISISFSGTILMKWDCLCSVIYISMSVPCLNAFQPAEKHSSTKEVMGSCTFSSRFSFMLRFSFEAAEVDCFFPCLCIHNFCNSAIPSFLILTFYMLLFVSQYSCRKYVFAACNLLPPYFCLA